jgi:hypothetical protein
MMAQRPASPSQPLLPLMWTSPFQSKVDKNHPVWKDYVRAAAACDTTMVDDWNKTLDVVLVFVSAPLPSEGAVELVLVD